MWMKERDERDEKKWRKKRRGNIKKEKKIMSTVKKKQ